jgi:hypothetical protein
MHTARRLSDIGMRHKGMVGTGEAKLRGPQFGGRPFRLFKGRDGPETLLQ